MAAGETTGTVSRSPEEAPALFARKATGLVRELGLWDVFLINFSNVGPVVNFVIFVLLGVAVFPGASLWLSALTGVGVGTAIVVVYSLLAGAMPRSGGDYVFVSRLLHPALGFVTSWTMALTAAFWPAYAAWALPNWVLPGIFGPIGVWTGNKTLSNLAVNLPKREWMIIVGLVLLVSFFLIGSLSVRAIVRAQLVGAVLTFLSIAVAVPWLLLSHRSGFTANFNSFAGHYGTSSTKVLAAAHKAGYTGPAGFSLSKTIAFWPFIMLLTGYAITSISMSGEVRKPLKTQLRGTLASNWLGGILLALLLGTVALKVDSNIFGALGYFDFINPAASPFPYPLYGHVMVGIAVGSPFVTILLGLAVAAGLWTSSLVLQAWSTRYVFAWSFDRMFPAWASRLSGKTRSPRNALVLVGLVGVMFMFMLDYWASFTIVATGLLQMVVIIAAAVAGIVLPWRRRELYESSIKREFLGIPVITIAGIAAVALSALMAYYFLTDAAYGATSSTSWKFAGILVGSGILMYIVIRAIRALRGEHVELAYREIPPE